MLLRIGPRWNRSAMWLVGAIVLIIGLGLSSTAMAGNVSDLSAQPDQPFGQYILVNRSMSWSDANLYCEKRGAHLATITSATENQVITSLVTVKGMKKQYWIGGVKVDDQWQWITGESFSYANWVSSEPSNWGPDENRLSIIGNNNSQMPTPGAWDDSFNDGTTGDFALSNYGLICERADSPNARYAVVDKSMPWTQAVAYCDERGAHLATITSAAENQAIISQIMSNGTKKEYWLGGFKANERWKWLTDEKFSYVNWAGGEPTNFGPDENRLSIIGKNNSALPLGVWDDNFNRGFTGDFALDNIGLICEWAPR